MKAFYFEINASNYAYSADFPFTYFISSFQTHCLHIFKTKAPLSHLGSPVDCIREELSDGSNDDGVVGSWLGSGVACRAGTTHPHLTPLGHYKLSSDQAKFPVLYRRFPHVYVSPILHL